MKIFDFTYKHIEKASTLALETYKEERNAVPSLPIIESVPDLTGFADNGLGVVAVEEGEIIGFLCNYLPFDHAFGSTDAKGMFSPMGGHAAIKENRAKIYATMYQAVATKWVKAGAVSHAICLYAHDEELQWQFYKYGFGLRCMDAVRSMEQIPCSPCMDYNFEELLPKEYNSIYPLDLALNRHYHESPFFMNRKKETKEEFAISCIAEGVRYFVAKQHDDLVAYLQISNSGETFITDASDYCHINGAFCLPEHRGKDIYQNLMNFTISTLKMEGYTRIGVDFESLNPSAYGFWLKYFNAYTHGVVRRIDEHILKLI